MGVSTLWQKRRRWALVPAIVGAFVMMAGTAKADELRRGGMDPKAGESAVTLAELADQVNPYGYWIDDTVAGRVWRPRESLVGSEFVPYLTGGWWTQTPLGRQFGSIWPWGRVVFHYGRWFVDDKFGWVWSPGTVWGSAWVDWRTGDELVGWSPTPPAELACRMSPRWVFVPRDALTRVDLARHVVERESISTAMAETRPGPQWGVQPLACKHPQPPDWATAVG
ncbi:MAG: hypothetical protein HY905_11565 [Deltaproteobacteria bacterium]|nr:hypothetical protein [Deltaproteobacteria bacterium]